MIKKKTTLFISALAGLWAADVIKDAHAKSIHCKGIATKWVNDCAANGHQCHAQATSDFDANEFISMSKEDCTAIKKALKNSAVKKYVQKIRSGTVVAVKRGKKF